MSVGPLRAVIGWGRYPEALGYDRTGTQSFVRGSGSGRQPGGHASQGAGANTPFVPRDVPNSLSFA